MMMKTTTPTPTQKQSVLMFPWLAHGHVSPFLELAKRLAERDFHVYFCSTPINLRRVRDTLDHQSSHLPSIQLLDLLIPCDDFPQLPPHYHTTKDLPPHLMSTLKTAFDSSKASFSNILKLLKPNLVIYDYLQPWAPSAAGELNIKAFLFLTIGSASCSYMTYPIHHNNIEYYPFSALKLPERENQRITQLMDDSSNGYKNKERFWDCTERSSDLALIKTSRVIEEKYIDFLSELVKKEVVTVGPLLQEPAYDKDRDEGGREIVEWLNKRQASSVVFVSFGSEYFLSKEEREEIAFGLELSNVGFIWVVRFHGGGKVPLSEALPQGFLDRVRDRGMVVEGWAPQAKILAHESIGGFVSHCGWSSAVEGILFGVPIIAVPKHLDQPLNAKLLVEIGVAVEVVKNGESDGGGGVFKGKDVARVIQEVVVEEKGQQVKRNAQELSQKMRERQDQEMDAAVEKLKQLIGA